MSKEENLTIQTIGGEIGATRHFHRSTEVSAENVVDHDAVECAPPGVEGSKQWWRELCVAFPDCKLEVDTIFGDEDHVAFAYRRSGTHQGNFLGCAPTGRHFQVRSLQISKFTDAKVSERSGATDLLGILTQPGLVELPRVAHD